MGDVLTTNASQGATVTEHIYAIPGDARHRRQQQAHKQDEDGKAPFHVPLTVVKGAPNLRGQRPGFGRREMRTFRV
jgi:hypothetical protein